MYRVVVGEIVATGKGPSKKKAKHNAAQEALEKIREVVASAAGQDMSQVGPDQNLQGSESTRDRRAPVPGYTDVLQL